ncbi:hypothetical protein [Bacillus sp. PK3_68]|uniref:DoxX family protein n=1 Tax=Bacillus sp. PK3_68 TaxID=2027408 RepID=UPI000E756FE4|nr:hypothetical protein [Bacillus sp. PK3_68]RJS61177.1 hypothetical protein CJ483_14900 [Bacillus sp. PK3_68]
MRQLLRFLYGIGLFAAGILHFTRTAGFQSIIPRQIPFKKEIVWISGVIEMLFGGLLLLNKAVTAVSRLLPTFFVAVFPANIYMAVKNLPLNGKQLPKPLLWGRLPLQWLLIRGARKLDQ